MFRLLNFLTQNTDSLVNLASNVIGIQVTGYQTRANYQKFHFPKVLTVLIGGGGKILK